jgi:hypothetical protein
MGDDPTAPGPPKTQGDVHGDGVFAGCSFTDLGLNPILSDQLKGRPDALIFSFNWQTSYTWMNNRKTHR